MTEGILSILDDHELEGVLAHELAHVKNRDVLIATVAATLAGAITYLAQMAQWAAFSGGSRGDDDERGASGLGLLVMAVLAPIGALIVQLAVSRAREFQADATGARLAGQSLGLACVIAPGSLSACSPECRSAPVCDVVTVNLAAFPAAPGARDGSPVSDEPQHDGEPRHPESTDRFEGIVRMLAPELGSDIQAAFAHLFGSRHLGKISLAALAALYLLSGSTS